MRSIGYHQQTSLDIQGLILLPHLATLGLGVGGDIYPTGKSFVLELTDVNSSEDIIGGKLWIGVMLLCGGAWHILIALMEWVMRILRIEVNAILDRRLGYSVFVALG